MIELDAKRCRIRQSGFNATTEANAIAPGAADTRRADLVALIADAAIHASAVIDHQARAAADAPPPLGFDTPRRSEERRGGKACVDQGTPRWSPHPYKTKKKQK